MKVLYDFSAFAGEAYGGVSRQFYELITHCCNYKDYHPLLVQGFHINEFPLYEIREKLDFYFSFKHKKIPKTTKIFDFVNLIITRYYLNELPFDIYHPTGYSRAVYRIPKKRRKYKVVLTVHDMIPEYFPEQFADIKKRLRTKRLSIVNSDYIICVSHNTKNDLQSIYDIADDKISVIYPGVKTDNTNFRNYPEVKSNKPYFLYVGTRTQKYKNFSNLLKAFVAPKLSNKFNLIAFGGGNFTKEEMKLIKDNELTKSVFWRKGDDRLLQAYYKNSYALVYPSIYEGFGKPLLEAMQLGCPVLASNAGSIPEIAKESILAFNPNSSEDIRDKMLRISEDTDLRFNLMNQGLERAKFFTCEKTAKKTYEVYKRVLTL